ncbi:hypothetical protein HQQ81_20955 [Microbacteriaceae bacterium VKM Ac-2854]|nr:hypothetical protein [Microbacteriaceae bacterium VKM Ac-2854]
MDRDIVLGTRRAPGTPTVDFFAKLTPETHEAIDRLAETTGATRWAIIDALVDMLKNDDGQVQIPDNWVFRQQMELPIDRVA